MFVASILGEEASNQESSYEPLRMDLYGNRLVGQRNCESGLIPWVS